MRLLVPRASQLAQKLVKDLLHSMEAVFVGLIVSDHTMMMHVIIATSRHNPVIITSQFTAGLTDVSCDHIQLLSISSDKYHIHPTLRQLQIEKKS